MFTTKSLALVAALVASSSAQLLMTSPITYGYTEEKPDTRENGAPVQPGMFPCSFPDGDGTGLAQAKNIIPLGEQQEVKLVDNNVQGGGSCQFSLTTDVPPTAKSIWKTFYSIEGGCPLKTDEENLPDGQDAPAPKFTIPNSIAPGEYSFAWTWAPRLIPYSFMYCAPITTVESEVEKPTEEEKKQREIDLVDRELPDMWFGSPHIPDTCFNQYGNDVEYPNHGENFDRFGDPENLLRRITCPGDDDYWTT